MKMREGMRIRTKTMWKWIRLRRKVRRTRFVDYSEVTVSHF